MGLDAPGTALTAGLAESHLQTTGFALQFELSLSLLVGQPRLTLWFFDG